MKKRRKAEEAVVFALLAAADLSAAIFIRHEDRAVRAVRIWEADLNAAEYSAVIESMRSSGEWIAIDAFAELHEIRECTNELYDPYRELLKECSEYTQEAEEQETKEPDIAVRAAGKEGKQNGTE